MNSERKIIVFVLRKLLLLLRSNTNKKRHQMCNNNKIIAYYCQYPTNHCHLFRFAVHVLHFVSFECSNLELVVSNFCQVILIQFKNESQIHSGRSESSGKLSESKLRLSNIFALCLQDKRYGGSKMEMDC